MREVSEIKRKTSVLLGLALFLSGGIDPASGGIPSPGQETAGQIEPFYLRLLKSGENDYIAGRFREAAQDLKVAVFGLYADPLLLARAQALLGLSLFKTGDPDAGRESIEKSLASIGRAGRNETLELPASAAVALADLIKKWKLAPAGPEAAVPVLPAAPPPGQIESPPEAKAAKEETATASPGRVEELKKAVTLDPRDAAAYKELADLQLLAGDAAAAKDTLKSMIKKNPVEIEGHLMLGRLCYRQKDYKEADGHLEKYLDLAGKSGRAPGFIAEAQALRILAAALRDDSRKARKLSAEYRDSFGGETIDSLPLFPEDKVRLRSILAGR